MELLSSTMTEPSYLRTTRAVNDTPALDCAECFSTEVGGLFAT